jgi:hypothetical protein
MHRTLVLLISCLLLPIVAAGRILWQSAAAPSKTLRDYRKLCLKLRYAIKLFHIQAHVASVGRGAGDCVVVRRSAVSPPWDVWATRLNLGFGVWLGWRNLAIAAILPGRAG